MKEETEVRASKTKAFVGETKEATEQNGSSTGRTKGESETEVSV